MRYLIFLILAGFTGVTAWGQTSTTARPMAVNDTLTEDSTYVLQEVVVRTSPVKRKADRFILSVPPAQNKDGVELLQQAPGVWLSDERISINGSSGTKVFVDNREIKLTGEMLIGYLRSLKSDDIARVEVLPMAGADKDADAQGGAIHIIMRRHTDKGFQGNLSMNASFASSLQSYQPSGSLNYHSGKWDTYGFASGTLVPQNKGDLYVTRDYVAGDKGFSSLTRMKQPSRYGTIRMGTVYTMDSSNSLGVELEYVRRGYIWPSQSYSTLSVGPLDMESQGVYRQKETYNMYTATANYIHKLDKDGSVLKASTNGNRASNHIGAQVLATSAGFEYTDIPYGGTADQLLALRQGEVDFSVAKVADFASFTSEVKVLAVYNQERLEGYPDVPTMGELGYYDQWLGSSRCIVAPAGTPENVIKFYEDAFQKLMEDADYLKAAEAAGAETN